jgi:primosomal protein N' (replication factor Y)
VDILVGTQMIAKGHDFRRMGLIAVLQADASLYSNDFRATERLFALLLQAAGRAGRDGAQGETEMWVQTQHPQHLVFQALRRHDYPHFAQTCLQERKNAEVPPWSHQALLRAEAKTLEEALAFLEATLQPQVGDSEELLQRSSTVTLYAPVPMGMQRIANVERAQLLVESPSRMALQGFLQAWQDRLHRLTQGPDHKRILRWALDVDPQQI